MKTEIESQSKILFSFCPEQIAQLQLGISSMNRSFLLHKHISLRPEVQCENNEDLWFQYIVNTVIAENRKKFTVTSASKKYYRMCKYIEYYKKDQEFIDMPWGVEMTEEESKKMYEIEDQLSWQEICRYRTWAQIEIKIEAKRHMSYANGEITNKKLF